MESIPLDSIGTAIVCAEFLVMRYRLSNHPKLRNLVLTALASFGATDTTYVKDDFLSMSPLMATGLDSVFLESAGCGFVDGNSSRMW